MNDDPQQPTPERSDHNVVPAEHVGAAQALHVMLCNVVPLLVTIAAAAWHAYHRIAPWQLGLLAAMWTVTLGLGGTVGYHRYFTHRAFTAHPAIRILLAICGAMAAQGPLIAWVATHRRHHERSDQQGDPHSPNLHGETLLGMMRGLWHAHAGWLIRHDVPSPLVYAPDLVRDRLIARISSLYYLWVVLGLVIPGAIGYLCHPGIYGVVLGVTWGGFIRIFLTSQCIWCINSVCHMIGRREVETRDGSKNNAWLAIPSCGESWHNNHHASPSSARFGRRWWQIDIGYMLICAFWVSGLAWDIKTSGSTPGNEHE